MCLGRGQISYNGPLSDDLEGVEVPVMNQTSCRDAYPDRLVTNSMMCAGDSTERKSSCHGDSGGPLLIRLPPHNRWHVVGLVSWNEFCGLIRNPTVLTRVNHYLDWIRDRINSVPDQSKSLCIQSNNKRKSLDRICERYTMRLGTTKLEKSLCLRNQINLETNELNSFRSGEKNGLQRSFSFC